MTASRTRRSRSVSSGNGISANVARISKTCQPGCEGVEAKPAFGREPHDVSFDFRPTLFCPSRCSLNVFASGPKAVVGSETKVHPLRRAVRCVENLSPGNHLLAVVQSGYPVGICRDIPASGIAVE